MKILSVTLVAVALWCAIPFGHAQSSDDAAADAPKFPERSERLDIYGAGMCHTCEWRPRAKTMAAPEQCGADGDGTAKVAVFECGRAPNCDPVCNFVRCGE